MSRAPGTGNKVLTAGWLGEWVWGASRPGHVTLRQEFQVYRLGLVVIGELQHEQGSCQSLPGFNFELRLGHQWQSVIHSPPSL